MKKILVGAVAAAALVGVVAIGANAVTTDGEPPSVSHGVLDGVSNRSPEEVERDHAVAAAEGNLESIQAVESWIAAGRVPVSGPSGFLGYVNIDDFNDKPVRSGGGVHPVVDDSGTVVAYWATGVGAIALEDYEPGTALDLEAILKKKGLAE